ncbi:YcdB/YcdC domain-containing protein [Brevibacillus borstelensis]|uniref:YcdB/YcdC domain-containing protein n=1 Tax=Brevibacillus borstelensis TaxID=45462 RepID=UPI0030BAB8A6
MIQVKSNDKKLTAKTKEEAATYVKQEHGIEANAAEWREELSDDKQRKYYWWKEGTPQEIFVGTVAATGEITAFFTEWRKDEKKTFTREKAREIAIREMEKYLPAGTTEMMEIVNTRNKYNDKNGKYSFIFARVHQGMPVMDRKFSIYVEGDQITDFIGTSRAELSDKLPDATPKVSAEEAAKEFLVHYPLQLEYFYPEDNGKQALLVYRPGGKKSIFKNIKIDAVTGNLHENK